jgi:5-methyltetrahydropteroyltriglutamate--homocysteine methyltransferase
MKLFATDSMAHVVFSNCIDDVALKDSEAAGRDVANLQAALAASGLTPEDAFIGAVSPGQIAFNYPNQHYGSHEEYLHALADLLHHEYQEIIDAGFGLQIDSPDLAMAGHSRSVGSSVPLDWSKHLPAAIEALNHALEGIPAEKVRLHLCWGNYGGPHHKDVPLRDIIEPVLKANVGVIYPEGGNPRHEHEWRVFEEIKLPDEMDVILGVIDTKSNFVEHPQVVADRLVRLANVIGKERVLAGTDCGFDTFIRFSLVDPGVAWLKLKSLVEGAALASAELW